MVVLAQWYVDQGHHEEGGKHLCPRTEGPACGILPFVLVSVEEAVPQGLSERKLFHVYLDLILRVLVNFCFVV